jgi:hypothetical protein
VSVVGMKTPYMDRRSITTRIAVKPLDAGDKDHTDSAMGASGLVKVAASHKDNGERVCCAHTGHTVSERMLGRT